ncbi:MAG: glycosyltransferase family 4 protein [Myxococcaceae bacterium]
MKRVVIVTSQRPGTGSGGALVTQGRIRLFEAMGAEVLVLHTSGQFLMGSAGEGGRDGAAGPGAGTLQLRTLLSEGYLPRVSGKVVSQLRSVARSVEFVFLDGLYTAEYGRAVEGVAPRVLQAHNVEHALIQRRREYERRPGRRLEMSLRIRRLRRQESRLERFCDLCLALTVEDQDALEKLNPSLPISLVEHPIDTAHYHPARVRTDVPELLLIGSMNWPANLDALTWFLHEVFPRIRAACPEVVVNVVGKNPPDWLAQQGPAVRSTGYVEDERPWFGRAAALVVPLRYGGGMRVKILNGWAQQTPIVSTSLGAEGLPARDGENLLIGDSAEAFADAVVRLVRDPARAEAIGAAGLRTGLESFSGPAVQARLADALLRIGVQAV